MKNSIKFLIGLQLHKKIELQEIQDIIFAFNLNISKLDIGKVVCSSLHKNNSTENKSILVISVSSNSSNDFNTLLQQIPNIQIFKRYIIADISLIPALQKESINFSYEKFLNEIEKSKLLYYPTNSKPICLLKSLYQHYYCIDGDVVWYNNTPISISKGKYYARQLYCEFYIDSIKTFDGYKIPADATISVVTDNVLPHFMNNQIVLNVEEYQCPKQLDNLLSNHFKIAVN